MPDTLPVLDEVTRRLLEQTLIPSPNVTALVDRQASTFVDRLRPEAAGLRADVAELFHANSKLSRHEAPTRFTDAEITAVKDWFFASCGQVREEDLTDAAGQVRLPHAELPPPLGALLAPFGPDGPLARLLYSVDLGLVMGGAPGGGARLCRQAPGADHLWVERHLGDATGLDATGLDATGLDATGQGATGLEALRRAVPGPAGDLVGGDPIAVVTGAPWRTMLFGGPRGYRRVLMEAGVLVNVVGSAAVSLGLEPRPIFDFYDDEVDLLLGNDGVERSVLALLVLRTPATAGGEE